MAEKATRSNQVPVSPKQVIPTSENIETPQPESLQRALSAPRQMTHRDVLRLQRAAGNQAVTRLLSRHGIQPRLTVGAAHDSYEQEADRVAQQVMTTAPEPRAAVQRAGEEEDIQTKPLISTISRLVQRQEDEEEVQLYPMQRHEEEEDIQAKADLLNSFDAGEDVEQAIHASKGSGNPLPEDTLKFMEGQFGADFDGVRIHNDSSAAQLNRQVGAQAFTHGSDIYLGEGKYNPSSSDGKQLLAHELTHTIQQGGIRQNKVQPKTIQRTLLGEPKVPVGGKVNRHMPGGDVEYTVVSFVRGTYKLEYKGETKNFPEKSLEVGRIGDAESRKLWETSEKQALVKPGATPGSEAVDPGKVWDYVVKRGGAKSSIYFWILYIASEIKPENLNKYLTQLFSVQKDEKGNSIVDFREPLGTNGDDQKRGVLQEMFEEGFTAFTDINSNKASELSPATAIKDNAPASGTGPANTDYAMMFRSDSRPPGELKFVASNDKAVVDAAAAAPAPTGFTGKAESRGHRFPRADGPGSTLESL